MNDIPLLSYWIVSFFQEHTSRASLLYDNIDLTYRKLGFECSRKKIINLISFNLMIIIDSYGLQSQHTPFGLTVPFSIRKRRRGLSFIRSKTSLVDIGTENNELLFLTSN